MGYIWKMWLWCMIAATCGIFSTNSESKVNVRQEPRVRVIVRKGIALSKVVQEVCYACNVGFSGVIPEGKTNYFCGEGPISEVLRQLTGVACEFSDQTVFMAPEYFSKTYSLGMLPANKSFWDDVGKALSRLVSPKDFVLTPQAGTVLVVGTQAQQERVQQYMQSMQEQMNKQVCISVTFIEVRSATSKNAGFNWENIWRMMASSELNARISGDGVELKAEDSSTAVKMICDALSECGKVRSRSSATISATHNREALLELKEQLISFDTTKQRGLKEDETILRPTATDIGTFVSVTPVISGAGADKTVGLALDFRIIHQLNKENFPLVVSVSRKGGGTVLSHGSVPALSTQHVRTFVRLSPGRGVLLGGLLSWKTSDSNRGVPILSKIPLIGSLFGRNEKRRDATRLFLYVHVADPDMLAAVNPDIFRNEPEHKEGPKTIRQHPMLKGTKQASKARKKRRTIQSQNSGIK